MDNPSYQEEIESQMHEQSDDQNQNLLELESKLQNLDTRLTELSSVAVVKNFTNSFTSPNFKSGSTGWQIKDNGDVEFSNGNFRGDITGASGTFSGTITAATFVGVTITGSTFLSGDVSDFNIYIDGINSKIQFRDALVEFASLETITNGAGPSATVDVILGTVDSGLLTLGTDVGASAHPYGSLAGGGGFVSVTGTNTGFAELGFIDPDDPTNNLAELNLSYSGGDLTGTVEASFDNWTLLATTTPVNSHMKVTMKHLGIVDGITAPSTVTGIAQIYVDTSDGDLKVKFGDGTVKTIVTD